MKYFLFTIFILGFLPHKTMSQEVNKPTSYEVLGNPFSQPNIQLQVGRKILDWYGSGDVNNDGKIDSLDVAAIISGIKNDRADVNGDGIVNGDDSQLLSDYLNRKIPYLPGHWDDLRTREERISWLDKTAKIDSISDIKAQLFAAGWICSDFELQRIINFYGVSNIEGCIKFLKQSNGTDHFSKDNARFNIPVCGAGVTGGGGIGHGICCVLVGDDPLKFNDWYFFSNYFDAQIMPGNWEMDINSPVQIDSYGYVKLWDPWHPDPVFTQVTLLQLNQQNGNATLTDIFSLRQRVNPKTTWIRLTASPDTLINYKNNLSLATKEFGYSNIETNFDTTYYLNFTNSINSHYEIRNVIKRSYSLSDTVYLTSDNILKNFFYKVKHWNVIKLVQTEYYSNPLSGSSIHEYIQKQDSIFNEITVKDIEPPSFKLPPDITISVKEVLNPSVTGYPTNVIDNTGLPVDTSYSYSLFSEDSSKKIYKTVWTLTDKFGNSATGIQKVTVDMTTNIVKESQDALPKEFKLDQNYPNPFNPTTKIKFSIPLETGYIPSLQHVTLRVYDLLGRDVATLVNEEKAPGNYEAKFDGTNLPSGVYFYRLTAGSFLQTRKMVYLK